ncbi:MAG: glycosyltransferase family 2 protein [Arachnia sp.]
MKDVVIVIITYNSAACIATLLDSIAANTPGLDRHVVVVDNGSTDGTLGVLAGRDDIQVIQETNRGYAAGFNRGVAQAPPARSYLLLNPDLVVVSNLGPLLAALTGRAGIAAPRVVDSGGELVASLRRDPTILRAIGLNRTGIAAVSEYVAAGPVYDAPAVADWALGAALAISSECLADVGAWDESYFLYSEETDFCLRARDRGWSTVYEPRSLVRHDEGGSGRSDLTHQMQILNRVRLYRRRHGRAASTAYWLATIASEISWWLRGHRQSRTAVRALLNPAVRPPQLPRDPSLIPS